MDIHEFLENMPSELYFWLHDEVDGGDLEPFIMYYQNRAKERIVEEHQGLFTNKEDFINGFTLAIAYSHHERFTLEELRWIRMAMSLMLAPILTRES